MGRLVIPVTAGVSRTRSSGTRCSLAAGRHGLAVRHSAPLPAVTEAGAHGVSSWRLLTSFLKHLRSILGSYCRAAFRAQMCLNRVSGLSRVG